MKVLRKRQKIKTSKNNFSISMHYLIFVPVCVAILYAGYLIKWLSKQSSGNDRMVEISKAIQAGSRAYLDRQYKTVGIVAAALFVLIAIFLGWVTALGFLVGSGMSAVRSGEHTAELQS